MKPEEKMQKDLENHTIILMIGVAVFYDVLQAIFTIIFMGWLVGIFAGLTFYIWFKSHGISFMKPKRFLTFSGGLIIEIIPFLSALPAWTAAVTVLALDSKIKKVVSKIPGGQIAESVLQNKMRVAQANSSIREQAPQINRPGSLTLSHNEARPPSPTSGLGGGFTQHAENWKNASNRLSDIQTNSLINKNYKGGKEQYAKDEEKQTADRIRGEEARAKLQKARSAYLEEDRNLNYKKAA